MMKYLVRPSHYAPKQLCGPSFVASRGDKARQHGVMQLLDLTPLQLARIGQKVLCLIALARVKIGIDHVCIYEPWFPLPFTIKFLEQGHCLLVPATIESNHAS